MLEHGYGSWVSSEMKADLLVVIFQDGASKARPGGAAAREAEAGRSQVPGLPVYRDYG